MRGIAWRCQAPAAVVRVGTSRAFTFGMAGDGNWRGGGGGRTRQRSASNSPSAYRRCRDRLLRTSAPIPSALGPLPIERTVQEAQPKRRRAAARILHFDQSQPALHGGTWADLSAISRSTHRAGGEAGGTLDSRAVLPNAAESGRDSTLCKQRWSRAALEALKATARLRPEAGFRATARPGTANWAPATGARVCARAVWRRWGVGAGAPGVDQRSLT